MPTRSKQAAAAATTINFDDTLMIDALERALGKPTVRLTFDARGRARIVADGLHADTAIAAEIILQKMRLADMREDAIKAERRERRRKAPATPPKPPRPTRLRPPQLMLLHGLRATGTKKGS